MKVASDGPVVLEENEVDDYGCLSCWKSSSQRTFLLRDNLIDMTFKLDLQRVAIVYPGTVRYVCSELRRKGRRRNTVFHVGMAVHEDIIASL